MTMTTVAETIEDLARRTRFSGVVRVDEAGGAGWSAAYGSADRAHEIANTPETIFGLASGAKGFTALTVASLTEDGTLGLDTTARSILGEDLPLIGDDVTVEHLLGHRSGIGDYVDESAGHEVTDHILPIPVHRLVSTEDYLAVLEGFPTVVRARRAVRVLQRRLRGVGVARGARGGGAVPRAGPSPRVRAGRDDRHRVPPVRRAARSRRARLLRRRAAHQRPPSPGARERRRRDLQHGRRHPLAVAGAVRGTDRPAANGGADGAPAKRRPGGGATLRTGVLAACDERRRDAHGLRRRRVVPLGARAQAVR